MIYLSIYIIIGILWGKFAAKKQKEIYNKRITLCFIVNSIFWPIAIVIFLFLRTNKKE